MANHKYEVVKEGEQPTFNNKVTESFLNPVSIGHKIKCSDSGSNLLLVKSIEHYSTISVLYVSSDFKY